MTPEELAKLSPEQRRIRIAEACGYRVWRGIHGRFMGLWADKDGNCIACPKYTEDLNAMHEAEETLRDKQKAEYVRRLESIHPEAVLNFGANNERLYPEVFLMIHTTAAQRAEAFLLTID